MWDILLCKSSFDSLEGSSGLLRRPSALDCSLYHGEDVPLKGENAGGPTPSFFTWILDSFRFLWAHACNINVGVTVPDHCALHAIRGALSNLAYSYKDVDKAGACGFERPKGALFTEVWERSSTLPSLGLLINLGCSITELGNPHSPVRILAPCLLDSSACQHVSGRVGRD